MKHSYALEGYGYRLRPVRLEDAQLIIDIRTEDPERNRYIHTISGEVTAQEEWLQAYFEREGDAYFVIENRVTGEGEGLIAFYNEEDGKAEWGRWVIRKGSLAATESVLLIYRIAFEQAGLQELYCRTIADNTPVVSFHTSIGEQTRGVLKQAAEIDGKLLDEVEQYAGRKRFYETIAPGLTEKAQRIGRRNLIRAVGHFSFHHIGVATRGIEKEFPVYTLRGYQPEGKCFEDPAQGIRGLFLQVPDQPRLELLENLPGSHTLDLPLSKGQKMYHSAYLVEDIERWIDVMKKNRARMISPLKQSTYFSKRICFMIMPNMEMVELIEK